MTAFGPSNRRSVLVIDDNPAVLDGTRAALELAGFRVLTRDRVAGTLVAILRDRPDLILLDISMTSWTASALSDIIGRARAVRGCSVVLYSSLPSNALRMKVQACGAHGFIQKTNVQIDLVRQVQAFFPPSDGGAAIGSTRPEEGSLSSGGMRAALAIQEHRSSVPIGGSNAVSITIRNSSVPESGVTSVDESALSHLESGTVRLRLPTVLFLDDDLQVLTGYRRALSSEELTGEYLTSADQALRRISADHPPDVLVTDLVLPGMNGIELYRRAVELEPTWRHRIVFVTGASTVGYVADFLRRVAGRALPKPIDMRLLRDAIRYAATGARIFRKHTAIG